MTRTVIANRKAMYESILVWIEDENYVDLPFKDRAHGPNPFATAGGALCTNTGMSFSKQVLQEIVNNMSDKGELFICSPYSLNNSEFFLKNG